jgi:two-component system, NarL family, nitrate/nitrite response regulator NarL
MNDLSINTIRIVILDNHILVRAGLRYIVESQPDLKVVGQAGNPNEALSLIASTQPDIILFEYDPKSGLSFEVFPDINKAWNQARLILVTGSNDRQIYLQAVQHGVLGIVSKTQPPDVLIKAIRKVHIGEAWIEHSVIANLVTNSFHGHSAPAADPDAEGIGLLSERESEIIQFIGRGLKNKQIASQLCIAETTVRHHLTRIYSKLGVSDRLELLIFAQVHGLT